MIPDREDEVDRDFDHDGKSLDSSQSHLRTLSPSSPFGSDGNGDPIWEQ